MGPELSARERPWSELGYLHHPGSEDDVKGISHWLIADFDTKVPLCCSSSRRSLLWSSCHTQWLCLASCGLFSDMLLPCRVTATSAVLVSPLLASITPCPECPHRAKHVLLQAGQALILAALDHLGGGSAEASRIAFVHNPSADTSQLSLLSRSISAAAALLSRRPKIGPFLHTLLQEHTGAVITCAVLLTLCNRQCHDLGGLFSSTWNNPKLLPSTTKQLIMLVLWCT